MSIPVPASTAEAMDMVLTGLRYLAAADPAVLAAQAQAECLQATASGGQQHHAHREPYVPPQAPGHASPPTSQTPRHPHGETADALARLPRIETVPS